MRSVHHISGSTEGKFCLCLGVSELAPCLSEFNLHCGKGDQRQQVEMKSIRKCKPGNQISNFNLLLAMTGPMSYLR